MTDENGMTVPEPVDEPLAETPMPPMEEVPAPEAPALETPAPEVPAPPMPAPPVAPPAPPMQAPPVAPPTPGYATQSTGPAPVAGAAAPKSRVTAGVLGILLGSLGVHKFYLGYTTAGIIMAVVSIVSFGFLAPVVSVIGLIEGILYLTKTDEQFTQEYVYAKKQWF